MIQSITFFNNPTDILKLYDDKTIEYKNTWDDWHILPTERPVFAPPDVKTTYIDVPGGNGSLDLSESLTKYPLYNNRSGSFKFRVMNDYEKDNKIIYESKNVGRWAQRYSDIMEYLHGKNLYAVLADDPNWFYQGRFSVDSWESGDTWSEIGVNYNVNPFKWHVSSSISDWLWDPFNFETDSIYQNSCENIAVNSPNSFMEISFPSYILDNTSVKSFLGSVPIFPTILFTPSSSSIIDAGLYIRFVNTYLGIDITQHFTEGSTFVPDFIFYGQNEPYKMYFKGTGTVSIDFRIGRL